MNKIIKWDIDKVRNFVKENGNCQLISTNYINQKIKMKFQCDCGKEFETSFYEFKSLNKRQCNDCGRERSHALKRNNTNDIENEFKKRGLELIDSYKNNKIAMYAKNKNGYILRISYKNLMNGKNPPICSKNNMYSVDNIKLWLKQNNKPYTILSEEYESATSKLTFQCEQRHMFEKSWNAMSSGVGCPYCSGRFVTDNNCLEILYPEIANEWHPSKNKNLKPSDVSYGSNKKVWWECNEGHEWIASVNDRTRGNGCPFCNMSKGEIKIKDFLIKNNINNMEQFKFNDCKGMSRRLPFDFAIFDNKNKLMCLVEYDGEQHFQPIRFGGKSQQSAEKEFQKRIKNDNIKNTYCKNNEIKLIRIPYWDFSNLEDILQKELSNLIA